MPHRVAGALAGRLTIVRARHPQVRWLAGDQLHLTLAFIRAMPADLGGPLAAVLQEVAEAVEPFEIRLGGAGSFGGRGRQLVAWIGVAEGQAAMASLAGRVTAACRDVGALPDGAAGPPDATYRPHLSVARRAAPAVAQAIAEALASEPEWRPGWLADELVLVRSHLGPPTVRYEIVARLPLGG